MDVEIQVAVKFVTAYLYNKLPRRRVELLGEALAKNLGKKFEDHWYPDRPSKGSGYRCLLISHSLDPVLLSSVEESGLDVKDVQLNLPEKLSLWIDPFEVSYRVGEQGPVKVMYKEEQPTTMKRNEICDETARWVSLLNGFNGHNTSPVSFEKTDRLSPVSPTPSASYMKNFGYPYSAWSRGEEPQNSKAYRLSATAKEFVAKPAKAARVRSPIHQNSWTSTAPEQFRGSPSFLNSSAILDSWFGFNDFSYKDAGFGAAQLPIMA